MLRSECALCRKKETQGFSHHAAFGKTNIQAKANMKKPFRVRP